MKYRCIERYDYTYYADWGDWETGIPQHVEPGEVLTLVEDEGILMYDDEETFVDIDEDDLEEHFEEVEDEQV